MGMALILLLFAAPGCLPEPRDDATLEAGYANPNNAACTVEDSKALLSNTPEPFPSHEDMFATCLVDKWNDCKTMQMCAAQCAATQGVSGRCSACFGNMGSCMDKNCTAPCFLVNPSAASCSQCIVNKCNAMLRLCLDGASK